MKKFCSLFLAGLLAWGLGACTHTPPNDSENGSENNGGNSSEIIDDSSNGSDTSSGDEFDSDADHTYGNLVLELDEGQEEVKILQLSDIQIIDPDNEPFEGRLNKSSITEGWKDRDSSAYNLVRQLVSYSDPDLIVLIGDNIFGQFDPELKLLDELISVMDSFEIPWTTVMGNHDEETPTTEGVLGVGDGASTSNEAFEARSAAIAEKYENAQYSLYERGDPSMGNGNFTITVKQGKDIQQLLVFMDTHGCYGSLEGGKITDGMLFDSQIEWYEQQIKGVNEAQYGKNSDKVVNSLIFTHVAMPEFKRAQALYSLDVPMSVPEDNPNGDFGGTNGNINFYGLHSDLFAKAKELGSTKGFFCGHNHQANFSILYEGIRLTFGNKTGTYDSHSLDKQGGTLITLTNAGQSMFVRHIYDTEVADIEI
ncbi:MAG: metallophosphoesterase [Clostridia bacterium]|nr:metallophosphoesterase [Clostridia bacterium]MBQ7913875.1 metallophosphoesterase [Clostridia bacterium]